MTKLHYDYAPGFCGELLRDNGTTLCVFETEPTAEDARRLVACWNACDGHPIEFIEELAQLGGVTALTIHANDLRAQRDELLAAAVKALAECADLIGTTAGDALSAAIQKATNKEQA